MPFFAPSLLYQRPKRLSVLTAATANEWSLETHTPVTAPPALTHASGMARKVPPPPLPETVKAAKGAEKQIHLRHHRGIFCSIGKR